MDQDGLMYPKPGKQKKKRKTHRESIICRDRHHCFMCGRYGTSLHCHHIFGGPDKAASERYGLKVFLCHICHENGSEAVHNTGCRQSADYLHTVGQQAFEEQIGTREQFMREFRKNYLGGTEHETG